MRGITMTFNELTKIIMSMAMVFTSFNGLALEANGDRKTADGSTLSFGSSEWQAAVDADGLVALYLFEETSGPVRDVSGYTNNSGNLEPLNLVIDNPDAGIPGSNQIEVERTGTSIKLRQAVLIHSQTAASKIIRECKASGELTMEAWVENGNNAIRRNQFPMRRIMTLSNTRSQQSIPQNERYSSFNTNFYMAFNYDEGPTYKGSFRTQAAQDGQMISSRVNAPDVPNTDLNKPNGRLQHIIMTKSRDGISKQFISFYDDEGNVIDNEHDSIRLDSLASNFNNWDDSAIFGIGNEISYNSDDNAMVISDDDEGVEEDITTEDLEYEGEIHLVAVYCKALSPADVLGDKSGGNPLYSNFSVDPSMAVSPAYIKAGLLYKRLAGVSTSLANPIIADMASDIEAGDLLAAAARATDTSDFYNITVRDFAAKMSNRAETVDVPLNDFIATIIGVTRDDINATQLLTGDYIYEGDLSKASVAGNKVEHMILSNRHYEELEEKRFDLRDVLVQKPQMLYNGLGETRTNFDAAGLLTSRGWMEAHASAGTNRRLVEFAFREFLCVPMEQWADAEAPDNFVGRDIDRFPAGDHSKYRTTCRSCHSVMDSLRGAYAYYDFSNGFVKNSFRLARNNAPAAETNDTSINLYTDEDSNRQLDVVTKMNHNAHTFPDGHMIENNYFRNQAVWGANGNYFGWNGDLEGYGVNAFGKMISESEAFPFCMAKRVFRSTCKRDPVAIDKELIENAAEQFKASSYNLKSLFQTIAISDECLGEEL
ncbi:MAG: hypothetical protein AAF202_01085 [Pseudomonadota bacterium]